MADLLDVFPDAGVVLCHRDPAKVLEMAKGFRVYYRKVPLDEAKPDGDYTKDHTASVYLLDANGRFTGTIAYGAYPEVAEQKLANLIKR